MRPTLDQQLVSSFLLFVDHTLQKYGSAYKNYSGLFYPIVTDVGGKYAYAAPFKALCNDTSISGANIMSGVYVNGTYTPVGSGNLYAINHYKGIVYFNSPLAANAVVSGNYAIKELNVELSDKTEWNLLFEQEYVTNNYYAQNLSGLAANTKVAPIIYVTVKGQENVPFAFRRIENSQIDLRCVVIADSKSQEIGVGSILKNTFEGTMPLMASTPFNSQGDMTGLSFNYDTNPRVSGMFPYISKVKVFDVPQSEGYKDIQRQISLVDFTLSTIIQNS